MFWLSYNYENDEWSANQPSDYCVGEEGSFQEGCEDQQEDGPEIDCRDDGPNFLRHDVVERLLLMNLEEEHKTTGQHYGEDDGGESGHFKQDV